MFFLSLPLPFGMLNRDRKPQNKNLFSFCDVLLRTNYGSEDVWFASRTIFRPIRPVHPLETFYNHAKLPGASTILYTIWWKVLLMFLPAEAFHQMRINCFVLIFIYVPLQTHTSNGKFSYQSINFSCHNVKIFFVYISYPFLHLHGNLSCKLDDHFLTLYVKLHLLKSIQFLLC